VITGVGAVPMLQFPELEAFTGCSRCKAAGTQTYSLYFKCPPTKQMRYPVKAYAGRAFAHKPPATAQEGICARYRQGEGLLWDSAAHAGSLDPRRGKRQSVRRCTDPLLP